MRSLKLIKTTKTPLYRTDPEDWYYEDGVPVFNETPVEGFECSIQPYRDGDNTFRSPEGIYSIYGIKVYTQTKLVPNDEVSKTVGDELEYEGKRFVCIDYANFTGHGGLLPEHYLGLFYRKDKM